VISVYDKTINMCTKCVIRDTNTLNDIFSTSILHNYFLNNLWNMDYTSLSH